MSWIITLLGHNFFYFSPHAACVSADLAVIVTTLSVGGVNKAFIDQRCSPDDTGSIRISHGVICYNGTTAGSVATHICDVGYQVPPGESDHRMCLVNGNWEGDVLICVEPQSGTYVLADS